MDSRQLFDLLCQRLGAEPDRRGEAHVTCPFCGKEPKRGQVHFSFSERGGYCWVCSQSAGLKRLAELWGVDGDIPEHVRPRPVSPPLPTPESFEWLARRYAQHEEVVTRWQEYKPLPEQVIRAYLLGYGRHLDYTSQCQHMRLQVPLVAEGKVVGFRSRSVSCDCRKWLSPKGSRMVLYNGERLGIGFDLGMAVGERRVEECVLYVVENPIDALLLEYVYPDVVAIATLGVANWKDHWTELIVRAHPAAVVVAYDNDRPGNGGGVRGREAWLANHDQDIEPNGVRLVNRLLERGVTAELFCWPDDAPLGADIGGEISRIIREGVVA